MIYPFFLFRILNISCASKKKLKKCDFNAQGGEYYDSKYWIENQEFKKTT